MGGGEAEKGHVRLHKRTSTGILKLTIPAHRPIKRSTLSHILKQAKLTVKEFNRLIKEANKSVQRLPAGRQGWHTATTYLNR